MKGANEMSDCICGEINARNCPVHQTNTASDPEAETPEWSKGYSAGWKDRDEEVNELRLELGRRHEQNKRLNLIIDQSEGGTLIINQAAEIKRLREALEVVVNHQSNSPWHLIEHFRETARLALKERGRE